MSDIDSILIHPIALLNVSANTALETGSPFGVLLGRFSSHKVIAYTSFEILFLNPKSNLIDVDYNVKRFNQFKTVTPEYSVVGIYHIKRGDLLLGDLSTTVLTQISDILLGNNQPDLPLVSVIFDANAPVSDQYFQGYYDINAVKTSIVSNESEFIAASTVAKFKDYRSIIEKGDNDDDDESAISGNYITVNNGLNSTVDHLQNRIAQILNFVAAARLKNLNEDETLKLIDINNNVVYLSNKLNSFRQNKHINIDIGESLQVSQLSLLTEQIVALDQLKVKLNRSIIRFGLN